MNHERETSWKGVVLGVIAGLTVTGSPAIGQTTANTDDSVVLMDNRGPGSINSGPGSVNSGPGSLNSGPGRGGRDDNRVAQASDVRQEDRRADRREDRRLDRREDRREDRRDNRGGETRGLDRADQVAGDPGQQGRDIARTMQIERPNRPEHIERPQRPDRPERPQRPERPERPERAGRN